MAKNTHPTADDFRTELLKWLTAAQKAERPYIDIKSGDLHRKVGGYPGRNHRMPTCCAVMRQEMKKRGDKVTGQPRKGNGATLIICYKLPR